MTVYQYDYQYYYLNEMVGIPTRNLHSGAEIVKYRDLNAVRAFAKAWLLTSEN